jgi:cytochrome bd-type quinol oxidase subunit 2
VNPLDYSHFLLWTGDLCFVAGLTLMAILSGAAGARIAKGTHVPMSFDHKGRPIWSLPRRYALLFAPVIAASCGLFLTFMAHSTYSGDLTKEALSLATARVGMGLAFVIAHIAHLAIVLKWLDRQK